MSSRTLIVSRRARFPLGRITSHLIPSLIRWRSYQVAREFEQRVERMARPHCRTRHRDCLVVTGPGDSGYVAVGMCSATSQRRDVMCGFHIKGEGVNFSSSSGVMISANCEVPWLDGTGVNRLLAGWIKFFCSIYVTVWKTEIPVVGLSPCLLVADPGGGGCSAYVFDSRLLVYMSL